MQETSLPTEFIERLKEIYPGNFEAIRKTFESPRPTTFRVNTLKTTGIALKASLLEQGFELKDAPIAGAFVLINRTQREFTETAEYKNGLLYIQGLSSMIPPLVLEPKPNETILDACSAPGSKTTQIAATMGNTGSIIANDMSRVRIYKLVANLKTLGVTNVTTMLMRAQDLWKRFPDTFDKVLADVPCSLEGRFLTRSPKSFANWSPKKIKILAEHQCHILRSASSCAKSGAVIIYSTCTISPEENEGVVDWILKKDPSLVLQNVSLPELNLQSGMTEWRGMKYSPEVTKCVRIVPSDLFEGFFLAKFVKR